LSSTALIGVRPEDAGVASALVNTTQQTGGSLGSALINTIATTATASYLVAHGHTPAALKAGAIHGYTTAFTFSGIVLAVAAATAFTLVRRAQPQTEEQPVVADHEDAEPRVLVTV
jgi:MFS superfamily sulfate permease-like transporter